MSSLLLFLGAVALAAAFLASLTALVTGVMWLLEFKISWEWGDGA